MKIIVLGATGLVGRHFVKEALQDARVKEVVAIVRRSTGLSSPKLRELRIDFDRMEFHRADFTGDVLFLGLGTTLKAAGSVAAQRIVDYDYQLKAAVLARSNDVRSLVLISATNANAKAFFAYPKMKGELEEAVRTLKFPHTVILRPSVLMGEREQERPMEELASTALKGLVRLKILRSMAPVTGSAVARAALAAVFVPNENVRMISSDEILGH